jgi:hypothetical protein
MKLIRPSVGPSMDAFNPGLHRFNALLYTVIRFDQLVAVRSNNVSGDMSFLTSGYQLSKEDGNVYIFSLGRVCSSHYVCLLLPSSFILLIRRRLIFCLAAYAKFLHWNYCLRELYHNQHARGALPRLRVGE